MFSGLEEEKERLEEKLAQVFYVISLFVEVFFVISIFFETISKFPNTSQTLNPGADHRGAVEGDPHNDGPAPQRGG